MGDNPIIEVRRLTSATAGHPRWSDLTFSVGRGEIVGFLGPNGRQEHDYAHPGLLHTGHFRFSACGGPRRFYTNPRVRRRIGYMPENNPLTSKCACAIPQVPRPLKGVGHPPQPRVWTW